VRRKLELVLIVLLLVALTGCFGLLKPGNPEELDLKAEKSSIILGGTNTLTVVGKDARGRSVAVEPAADAWSVEPADAGTITPDAKNPAEAVFKANEEFEGGEVTVKVTWEDLEAEITFEVKAVVITGVWAYNDIKDQDGAYKTDPKVNPNHKDGARQAPEESEGSGFARCYSTGAVFIDWLYGGHWISWDIDVPAAGEYALVLRYSCPLNDEDQQHRVRTLTIDGEDYGTFEFTKTPENRWGNEPKHWGVQVIPGITIEEAKTIELKLTHAGPDGQAGQSTALAYLALVSPPDVEIDEEFLLEIEQKLCIERDPNKEWNQEQ